MAFRSWILLCASMAAAGSALAQADKSTVVNPGLTQTTRGAAESREAASTGRAPAAAVPGVRAKPGGHDQEPPGQGPVKSRGLGTDGGVATTPGARTQGGQTRAPGGRSPSAVDRVGQPGLAAHADGQSGKQDQGSTQGPVKRGVGAQMEDQGGKNDQGSVQGGGSHQMPVRPGAQMAPHSQSGNQGQGVGQTGYRPVQQNGRNVGNSPVGQPNPGAAAATQVPKP